MNLKDLTQEQLGATLAEYLSPSREILTPERLIGRDRALRMIDRTFASPGRQVFIHGDRGVGKTSLAKTAAFLHTNDQGEPIYVVCGSNMSFGEVIKSVGKECLSVRERVLATQSEASGGLKGGLFGFGGHVEGKTNQKIDIPAPRNVADALSVMEYVEQERSGRLVVVIDELDRIRSEQDKELFAEFIKNVSTKIENIKFIYCGIGRTVDTIIGSHLSTGRSFESLELVPLSHDSMWKITTDALEAVGLEISEGMLKRISIVSGGFPHFVHLITESIIWSVFEDPEESNVVRQRHFKDGIDGAIERTEAELRMSYETATRKTKNTTQFEHTLFALADRAETKRQVSDVYERSYRRIFFGLEKEDQMEQKTLNARLNTMRDTRHGEVIVGHGAGWFSFSENVFRGYVRLKAEKSGFELTDDPT